MASHVSTKQIIEYIQTVAKLSVDGVIYSEYKITDTNIIVDKYTFPLEYFDIGGMDPNSLILIDTSHSWRRVQFHDANNVTLNHPDWSIEEYDDARVKNKEIIAIANQTKFDK